MNRFTAPKIVSPFYRNVKRVPRKFKKKYKKILTGDRYNFLTFEQKLWYILSLRNPEYHQFLINKISGYDSKN